MIAYYIAIDIQEPEMGLFGHRTRNLQTTMAPHLTSKELMCSVASAMMINITTFEYKLGEVGSWNTLHSAFSWFIRHKHTAFRQQGNHTWLHSKQRVHVHITVPKNWFMTDYNTTDSTPRVAIPKDLDTPLTIHFWKGENKGHQCANHFAHVLWLYTEDRELIIGYVAAFSSFDLC
jgi:hypothetical protein